MARAKPKPEETSAALVSGVTTLPLSALILSGLNVRQTERDADIGALAEDIAARGLKQNLVVIPAHFTTGEADKDWADKFEVIAGGRRFQAMSLLVADGRLPADHPVPVLIDDRAEARETSLSENLHRVAMNPADEFEAFAQIAAEWTRRNAPATAAAGELTTPEAIAYTAKRFGVTERHVAGRLRLAALAPEILEALRAGTVTLDSAKAYAGTTDHKLQLKVFAAMTKNSWHKHDPRAVREQLRGATIPLNDGRLIWVGLDAYIAAGGRIETEMFMGTDGEQRLVNVALLDKLCAEKAEPLLADLAKADGYKEGLFAPGSGWRCKEPKPPKDYVRVQYEYGEVPKELLKERIAFYTVKADGSGLHFAGKFKPKSEDKERQQGGYRTETAEERAARERAHLVDVWSARLAVVKFAGTPLEGKAFWPRSDWHTVEDEFPHDDDPVWDDEDADPPRVSALVTIRIRVTAEEIDAQRAAAEAKVDQLLAERAEREAAERAKREAAAEAEQDDDEGEFDDEDELEEEDAA